MGRAGFEHTPLTTPKTPISENTRTESGTVDGETQQNDPDLALLIEAWPTLPERIKQQIKTLVQAHIGNSPLRKDS